MKLNDKEESTMIYLEDCLVNQRGRVESSRMNQTDHDNITRFIAEGFLNFGRIPSKHMKRLQGEYRIKATHWVEFTGEAWEIAGRLRRERSERMIKNAPIPTGPPS